MHLLRVFAALVLGAVVGEISIGPAVEMFARAGSATPGLPALIFVPACVAFAFCAVSLLVLPVKAVK